MNANINIKRSATNKGKTAFLFMLALLMLVVSCPFKRLLQAENNNKLTASPKTNGIDRHVAAYEAKVCCAQKQKITLVKADVKEQKLQAPDFILTQNVQAGFALHYFLSGTEKHFSNVEPSSPSSLPLFLQHRRLLI